jgi:ubiquinone/menaquinone biosynthesis C-methylase UbiE
MKQDNMPQVARFWNDIATDFDAIYTGTGKSAISRAMDRYFRKDIYQRLDWVMQKSDDVRGKTICDIGCGSGRFVTEFAKRGAAHVTGVDVAPEMLKLAQKLVETDGVAAKCDFFHSDVLNWKTDLKFDTTIAIGFWDYIMEPPERLRLIRALTKEKFLSAWPRFWTWRMPVRKVRLQYIQGCPVYFFRKPQVYQMLEEAGFQVQSCETVGKLFCVEAKPK